MQEVIEVTENWVTVCKKSRNFFVNGGIYFVDILFHRRLASLIPSPKVNLTRFHGVFVPHFKHRALVVPEPPQEEHSDADAMEVRKSGSMSWAQSLKEYSIWIWRLAQTVGGRSKS